MFATVKITRLHRLILVALLLASTLLLCCHLDHDATRDVWTLTAPGLTVTGLRDIHTGLVLWVTVGGKFRGRWEKGQWESAEPTPYPTATPY